MLGRRSRHWAVGRAYWQTSATNLVSVGSAHQRDYTPQADRRHDLAHFHLTPDAHCEILPMTVAMEKRLRRWVAPRRLAA